MSGNRKSRQPDEKSDSYSSCSETLMPKNPVKSSAHTGATIPRRKKGILHSLRMATSLDDLRSLSFWRAVIAEFVGTFILVITALGSTVQGWSAGALDIVQIALCFGFCVATSVWIIGHISGGHINPAVTIGMLVTRRISLFRAILYIITQCLGAIAGAGILKALTPPEQRGSLGCTTLNEGMTPGMGVGVEFCITFFLVLTVFATCDSKRNDHQGSFPLSIGIAVSMGHFWAIEFTGSSMNTARSVGPAVVMEIWDDHWVYWVGPLSGGIAAGLIYDNLFASNASLRRFRDFVTSSDYDDDRYPANDDDGKIEREYEHSMSHNL